MPDTTPRHNLKLLSVLAPALLPVLASCAACSPTPPAPDRVIVAVTVAPVADFVRQVGGNAVSVTLMVPPGSDPHHYEPTPRQLVEVSRAAAYFKVGSGVEFELEWMDNLIAQNPHMDVVDCSGGITIEGGDPHIWTSPRNAAVMVGTILDGLVRADPAHADEYTKNAGAFTTRLALLDADIESLFSSATERHFMIFHPSFGYFAGDYGLVQLAIEEEGKSPSPHLLQDCIDLARQHHLHCVYVSPQSAIAEAGSIAEAIEGELRYIDPLPDDYLTAMRATAEAIALEVE